MIKIEVCANSVNSCIAAQKGGASRVELCDNLHEGGTTPSFSQIQLARKLLSIDLNVIVRPRGGDFVYDDIEFECMKSDIHHCGKEGVDGVVFGILTADGMVDIERNITLIELAKQYGMSVTFHRAFDRSKDLFRSLEDIVNIGCDRILTSGGKQNALFGKEIIKNLVESSQKRITIMPGSGITVDNIGELAQHTDVQEIHGSFQSIREGNMKYGQEHNELSDYNTEYNITETDPQKVRLAIANANKKRI